MHRFRTLGAYYFYLDCIARFYEGSGVRTKTKIIISLIGILALCVIAWQGAEWFTLRSGEYPGSLDYISTKYQYLMRLLCMESLLVTGSLFATSMAQQSGRIFSVSTDRSQFR